MERLRIATELKLTPYSAVTTFTVLTGASSSAAASQWASWRAGSLSPRNMLLRFCGAAATTISDGTAALRLGVYGKLNTGGIGGVAAVSLLGIIGQPAPSTYPLLILPSGTSGFDQIIFGASAYDDILIGGVAGTVNPSLGVAVTVFAYPLMEQVG